MQNVIYALVVHPIRSVFLFLSLLSLITLIVLGFIENPNGNGWFHNLAVCFAALFSFSSWFSLNHLLDFE